MKNFIEKHYGKILITLLLFAMFLITTITQKYDVGYWLWEDEIHVVQKITKPTFYETRGFYNHPINEKEWKEYLRPKPYKLITVYKGVVTYDYGDMKYLANIKCKRYNEAERKYLNEIAQKKKDELEQELDDARIEKEMDSIENLKCN
jgi:hypothetical protein